MQEEEFKKKYEKATSDLIEWQKETEYELSDRDIAIFLIGHVIGQG